MSLLYFKSARVFPYPHGTMCVSGEETWLLSSRKTDKNASIPILVIENSHAVGIIRLKPVGFVPKKKLISPEMFARHQHSRREIAQWWSDIDELWVDEIEVVQRFKRPIPVQVPEEAKVWVSPDKVAFLDVFERMESPIIRWRKAWHTGKWDDTTIWSAASGEFDDTELDVDKIADAVLYILITQGNPDLSDEQLGIRSNALDTITDFLKWDELETDTLKVCFDVLSLLDDEEYRNIALKRISKELGRRNIHVKPNFEMVAFAREDHSATLDVLDVFNAPAILYKDAVLAVGSVIRDGHGNDLDILIRSEIPVELAKRIAFRLGKECGSMPSVNFHIFQDSGPMSSFIPLYDVVLVPTERHVVKMSKDLDSVLFSPMEPMKPIRPGNRSTIDEAIRMIKLYGISGFCQPKADGVHLFIHSRGPQKMVFSEEGNDLTEILQPIISELPDGDYVLDAELETWDSGNHQPREVTVGNIRANRTDQFVISVFDCLYDGRDLRQEPFAVRLAHLRKICKNIPEDMGPPKDKIVVLPSLRVDTEEDLEKAIQEILRHDDKEGFVWKSDSGLYLPGQNKGFQIKWHRNTVIHGIVLGRRETKVAGVFNYVWGVKAGELPAKHKMYFNGEPYLVVGKTFSSRKAYNEGDEISVEAETINVILEKGTVDITAWAPKVVEEVDE